jgi:hypothetical protein
MEGEREAMVPAAVPDPLDLRTASLRARVTELRLEVLRLRASRRTLMALLEMEGRRRVALERQLARLRLIVRARRRAGRRTDAESREG